MILSCGIGTAADCSSPLVRQAIDAQGGRSSLAAVSSLHWQGTARIHSERGVIEIGVDTEVRPFDYARSESWLLSDGPAKSRSLVIRGEQGTMQRANQSTPMPAAMLDHERAQFAIYGLMLLSHLCDADTTLTVDEQARSITVSHPQAPRTTLLFDEHAHLIGARNQVPAPEGPDRIEQEFSFSEQAMPGAVRWPRTLSVRQNGKPYFDLELTRFDVGR